MTREQLSASTQNKARSLLGDNTMLVAAAAYYLDKLSPGWSSAGEIFQHEKTLPGKWRWHLTAIRRVLGMHSRKEPPLCRLAKDFKDRLLIHADLDLFDFKASREFGQLPADLTIDDAMRAFSQDHPHVLERTKAFLCRGYRRPRPPLPEFLDQPVPPDPSFPQPAPPKNTKPRNILRKKLWD